MELALYGPGGFFAGDRLRSVAGGDFLTSPEVSPLFGQTLGRFVAECRQAPSRDRGRGRFRFPPRSLAEGTRPGRCLGSRRFPGGPGGTASPSSLRSGFSPRSANFPEIEYGVLIANELIDNLPMALAQLTSHGWRERFVGLDGNGFGFVDATPRPEVRAGLSASPDRWPKAVGSRCNFEAASWLAFVSDRISRGALVLIDYGELAENLSHRRPEGTLRTYRQHHLGPHPLDEPGETDLTADVNFTALLAIAIDLGWEVSLHRQDDFLREWGLDERLAELRRQELDLAGVDEVERLRLRSLRTGGETLLHERGLGDFRVMIARR